MNSLRIKMEETTCFSGIIDVEFGREDHGSIPYNCDWEKTGTT
jgi:hypothetical protein